MNKSQTGAQVNVGVFQIAILILSLLALAALAADTVWELPPAIPPKTAATGFLPE
jgi:hypothetical protein